MDDTSPNCCLESSYLINKAVNTKALVPYGWTGSTHVSNTLKCFPLGTGMGMGWLGLWHGLLGLRPGWMAQRGEWLDGRMDRQKENLPIL